MFTTSCWTYIRQRVSTSTREDHQLSLQRNPSFDALSHRWSCLHWDWTVVCREVVQQTHKILQQNIWEWKQHYNSERLQPFLHKIPINWSKFQNMMSVLRLIIWHLFQVKLDNSLINMQKIFFCLAMFQHTPQTCGFCDKCLTLFNFVNFCDHMLNTLKSQ